MYRVLPKYGSVALRHTEKFAARDCVDANMHMYAYEKSTTITNLRTMEPSQLTLSSSYRYVVKLFWGLAQLFRQLPVIPGL